MAQEKRFAVRFLALFLPFLFAQNLLHADKPKSCMLHVLTYSSLKGKGSLGEWVQQEWAKAGKACTIVLESSKDLAGIWGSLKRHSKDKKLQNIDLVWGLSEEHTLEAVARGWIERASPFDFSPFAIVYNRQRNPTLEKMTSWKDLRSHNSPLLLVQDPRVSNTGAGWLRAIYEFKLLSAEDSKKLVKRSFPSWSASYEAFMKGLAPAVWTYLSSVAYHQCEEKSQNYAFLPLAEGYPVQKEFVALVAAAKQKKEAAELQDFLLSEKVQAQIPAKNWMYPVHKSVSLPACFPALKALKALESPVPPSFKTFEKWLEQWSLL
jgi:ABC transporter substrate-binding protein (ThiB subfamily)